MGVNLEQTDLNLVIQAINNRVKKSGAVLTGAPTVPTASLTSYSKQIANSTYLRNLLLSSVSGTPLVTTDYTSMVAGTGELTQMFGNVAGWRYSPLGGSRVIYGEHNPAHPLTPVQYYKLDCAKELKLTCDINIDTLRAGTVLALYLIPMQPTNATVLNNINPLLKTALLANPGLSAEWGVGYGDAQSVNNKGAIEIDIIEVSAVSIQIALHGYMRNIVGGKYTQSNVYEVGSTIPTYDRAGVWAQITGIHTATQGYSAQTLGTFDNMKYGPGPEFYIDSTKTFNVKATIKGPTIPSVDDDSITCDVTITQGTKQVVLSLKSPGFPAEELQNLQLVSSIWSTDAATSIVTTSPSHATWWLDGYDWTKTSITDPRHWARPNASSPTPPGTPPIPPSVVAPSLKYYDSYATPVIHYITTGNTTATMGDFAPIAPRIANLGVEFVSTTSRNKYTNTTPVAILDYMYRGVANTMSNWTGRHMHSYGMYFNNQSSIATSTRVRTSDIIPLPGDADELEKARAYYAGTAAAWNVEPPISAQLALTLCTGGTRPITEGTTSASATVPVTTTMAINYLPIPGFKFNFITV